jgi:SAM-dependent methyltransferase
MNEKSYWEDKYIRSKKGDDCAWLEPLAIHIKPQSYVLDIGCGTGEVACYLSDLGHRVVGSDFSLEVILHNAAHYTGVSWLLHDARDQYSSYEDGTFDVIISSLSIHYFDNQTLKNIINEMNRLLKRGGKLIFRVNSDKDEEASATQEIPRFYFSEKQIDQLFFNWDFVSLEEKSLEYFNKSKWLWQGVYLKKEA